ncbi:hypothetical protein Tsubulata_003894, partial [Turnera subulata]
MWVIRWGQRKKLELKEWDDGWDTDNEEEAADWFSSALDQAQRDEFIKREKHAIQTKGFDLPSAIPSGIIEPVNLGEPQHFQRIRALSNFAVAFFNKKKVIRANFWGQRCSYLLTLRVIESSTLEMKTYQTRISMEDFYYAQFPNKKRDHVEIFRPLPDYIDLEDSVDSQGVKRKRLDEFCYQVTEECDAGDATYAACSVCAPELYRLMAERARKFKLKYTLCSDPLRLDHPFHRCRIEQSVHAALAYHNQSHALTLSFHKVDGARLIDFGCPTMLYGITFHAHQADPIREIELEARVLYDSAQHCQMFEVKNVRTISMTGEAKVDSEEADWFSTALDQAQRDVIQTKVEIET